MSTKPTPGMPSVAQLPSPPPKMPLNIHQRINEVRKKAHYAKKDKEVAGQNYKAVTHDAITALLRNHLIDQGVLIVPKLKSSTVTEVGKTKSGTSIIRYSGWYDIDFINVDNPEDRLVVPGEAHANDSGDKAPGKATSYATKYAMLKVFNIETGEDDESRVEPYQQETIDGMQAQALEQLMKEVGADKAKFLEYLKVGSLEEIPAKSYARCLSLIESKRKAKKAPEPK